MNPLSFEPADQLNLSTQAWAFLVRDLSGARELNVFSRLQSFGALSDTDIFLDTKLKGILFSLLPTRSSVMLIRGHEAIELNGERFRGESVSLKVGDVLRWKDGHAVFMGSSRNSNDSSLRAHNVLDLLVRYSNLIREQGAAERGVQLVLDSFLKWSGAERAVLFCETADGSGWRKLSEKSSDPRLQTSARELMSHTVLADALKSASPVVVENLLEHPWSKAQSLVGQRIFSLACIPLIVDARALGALFLFTHTPGRTINQSCLDDLALLAGQASIVLATQNELIRLRRERASPRRDVVGIDGKQVSQDCYSPAYSELLSRVGKAAASPLPILVLGETGSGKERIARLIHQKSRVADGPFVALNCAAIPESLLESTLFGHEKGAFTGAVRSQPGRFQLADGGTLFLDEIADLSLPLQAKILRALQEGEVDPVGSLRPVKVTVRIVSATHSNLEKLVREGKFREDLFFRIRGVELKVPPLRERQTDIPKICDEILAAHSSRISFSPAALQRLVSAPWPGNIRELKQVVEQAIWMNSSGTIEESDLQILERHTSPSFEGCAYVDGGLSLREAQEEFTLAHVEKVLESCGGRRNLAAEKLGVSERTLYRILSDRDSDNFGREV